MTTGWKNQLERTNGFGALVQQKCLNEIIPALTSHCDLCRNFVDDQLESTNEFILDGITETTPAIRAISGGGYNCRNDMFEFVLQLQFFLLCGIPWLGGTWLKWTIPKKPENWKAGRKLDANAYSGVEINPDDGCADHEMLLNQS